MVRICAINTNKYLPLNIWNLKSVEHTCMNLARAKTFQNFFFAMEVLGMCQPYVKRCF